MPPATDRSTARRTAHPPLFAQLEARLRKEIMGDGLKPGDKLPSEAALATSFAVSRITVRHALAALTAKGLIEKVNGKGSFVTRPGRAPDLGPLTGFNEAMRGRGLSAEGRLLWWGTIAAPQALAHALRLAPGARVGALRALRLVAGEPVALSVTYGLPALIDALLREDLVNNDVMALLEGRLGHRLAASQIEAGAVAASPALAERLGIAKGAPLLHMRFTTYDVNDTPLCFSDVHFRADRFTYRARVRR